MMMIAFGVIAFFGGAIIGIIGTFQWVGAQIEKNYPILYDDLVRK